MFSLRVTLPLCLALAVAASAGLMSTPASTAPAAEETTVRLSVTANESTAYGAPWDGVRMGTIIGALMPELPTSSPPDLAACIITVKDDGPSMDCYHRVTNKRPISFCHDSFECSFELTVPKTAFGVIVYDIDTILGEGRNDLVDAFLVAGDGQVLSDLEDATRAAVRLISRTDVDLPSSLRDLLKRERLTIKGGEELRRQTTYKTFRRGECQGSPCKLSQSLIGLDWQSD